MYVDCKIVSEWLSLKTDDEKLNFFLHFTDIDYLKRICDFTNSYCSQFEYNSFSDSMKNVISSLYNEYILDFKNAFQECVDQFNIQIIPDGLTRTDAISSMLSFYINQGVWTALRIIPTKLCAFEKIMFHGKEQFNFDYIVNPIMKFNKNFELEPVFDNQQFYSDAARDCFLYFLTLTKKIYDSEIEIRLDRLEADVEILNRKDAFFAASQALLYLHKEFDKLGDSDLVYTTGKIYCHPNIHTVIPDEVKFSLDVRHANPEIIKKCVNIIRIMPKNWANCEMTYKPDWTRETVLFNKSLVEYVQKASDNLGYKSHVMYSGAGHDAQYLSEIVPTTMIFVPSKDGHSHCELEYSPTEWCWKGTNVLLNTILEIDKH